MKTKNLFFSFLICILISTSITKAQTKNLLWAKQLKGGSAFIAIDTNGNDSVKFQIKTFKTKTGWGYDLLMDGKQFIHQPTIPAITGNKSFITEADARKTAELVIYKIKNNIIPPSISMNELDSLGILKNIY